MNSIHILKNEFNWTEQVQSKYTDFSIEEKLVGIDLCQNVLKVVFVSDLDTLISPRVPHKHSLLSDLHHSRLMSFQYLLILDEIDPISTYGDLQST